MKTKTIYLLVAMTISSFASAQNSFSLKEMKTLPKDLQLKNEIQKYEVITDHFTSDIFCHFINKMRVKGEYTRGLDGGNVKWNDVSVAMSMAENAEFSQGTPISYMEDFTYFPGEDMIKADKFVTFKEYSAFTKNLVWDMLAIEGFAWSSFGNLELNEDYAAENFNGKIDLAGEGFFENKDVRLTWTGISERNGETCAVINYRTFRNPLEVSAEGMDMKGRSHYWGTIWVSLEDKEIEHAVLYEDVIMEMILPGQTQKQALNITREITMKKLL